jgi:hypothetical protein
MLTTRTRSIIIAGLASLSFAATTVAPAISQAKPLKPGAQADAATCTALWGGFQKEVANAEKLEKEGKTKQAEKAWAAASTTLGVFGDLGCISPTLVKAAPSNVATTSSATL